MRFCYLCMYLPFSFTLFMITEYLLYIALCQLMIFFITKCISNMKITKLFIIIFCAISSENSLGLLKHSNSRRLSRSLFLFPLNAFSKYLNNRSLGRIFKTKLNSRKPVILWSGNTPPWNAWPQNQPNPPLTPLGNPIVTTPWIYPTSWANPNYPIVRVVRRKKKLN